MSKFSSYIEPDILRFAILEMGRLRGNKSFCPSEVVRWLYPVDWRYFMQDVQAKMMELYEADEVTITQKGKLVPKSEIPKGPVRITIDFQNTLG